MLRKPLFAVFLVFFVSLSTASAFVYGARAQTNGESCQSNLADAVHSAAADLQAGSISQADYLSQVLTASNSAVSCGISFDDALDYACQSTRETGQAGICVSDVLASDDDEMQPVIAQYEAFVAAQKQCRENLINAVSNATSALSSSATSNDQYLSQISTAIDGAVACGIYSIDAVGYAINVANGFDANYGKLIYEHFVKPWYPPYVAIILPDTTSATNDSASPKRN